MTQLNRLVAGVAILLAPIVAARGQSATENTAQRTLRAPVSNETTIWALSGAALVSTFVLDERIRSAVLANRSPELDRLAGGADVIGTAGHIVPALVTTYVAARLLDDRSFAAATMRVGLSYAAADAVESVLKPVVGRVRPYSGREPLTFRPLSSNGDYHSFPSAHVVHVASLATGLAMEANRPWISALACVAVTYVGAQRIYRDQHWSSDVVASGMLGVQAARTAMNWLGARSAPAR